MKQYRGHTRLLPLSYLLSQHCILSLCHQLRGSAEGPGSLAARGTAWNGIHVSWHTRHTTHLRLLDKLTCDCKTSLTTAGTAESLATPDTASTFWGVEWGANTNASNVDSSRLRYWNQGCIWDSRMMWLVLLMCSMHAPPQLQARRCCSYK